MQNESTESSNDFVHKIKCKKIGLSALNISLLFSSMRKTGGLRKDLTMPEIHYIKHFARKQMNLSI
ncbi:hypothetical protein CW304_31005 [Bacillus sp. UFRGS-B20]|nr:hypothetical protein CW304_31005 [Bacillus sp. UFRGS-B20]